MRVAPSIVNFTARRRGRSAVPCSLAVALLVVFSGVLRVGLEVPLRGTVAVAVVVSGGSSTTALAAVVVSTVVGSVVGTLLDSVLWMTRALAPAGECAADSPVRSSGGV